MECPTCKSIMEDGYIPIVGGIHWRRKGQRVGLPSMLTGLPGTVWWNPFRRPKLPAYHCPKCKIIIFVYGE